jgi:hypothetical protein
MYPTTLFITWDNWVPSYTRNEIKKKTGIILDEKGNIVDRIEKKDGTSNDPNAKILNDRQPNATAKEQKQYTSIKSYKPTGNLVYNKEFFEQIEKKVSFA